MYKFCPKCGGELKVEGEIHEQAPVCRKCGFKFYQNSKPTSSALIINEKDEVLLLKRSTDPHFGKWDIPGGFLENGEDPITGLKREAKEELDTEVEPIELISINIDKYGYAKGDFYTLNLFYRAKIVTGEIKLDAENSEYKWFAEEDIPWNELAFNNTTIALKALFKVK